MEYFNNMDEILKHYTTTGAFLTASNGNRINTMTISWGFFGFCWKKPMIMATVRPQRYTKELLDKSDCFTMSIPFNSLKKQLNIVGTKSGRDINKSEIVDFVKAKTVNGYVVDGCNAYFECKILTEFQLAEAGIPKSILETIYPENDLHHLFFGEIVDRYDV